jgi:hypothetical protein
VLFEFSEAFYIKNVNASAVSYFVHYYYNPYIHVTSSNALCTEYACPYYSGHLNAIPLCLPANSWPKQVANCFHSFSVCAFFMTSRSRKGFAFSPEKDQCTSCGRFVVAGPMGLSRHFARNPWCYLDYATELNPCCQQDLFPFMQSSTGCQQTDVRQSNPDLIHTRKGPSNFNKLLSFLARDSAAHLSSRDIPHKDAGEEEDFPIVHDDSYDESAVGDKLSVQLDDKSPATLTPLNTVADAAVDTSILDLYVAHSNPLAMGYLFHYFQSRRKFRLTSCKLSRDFVPQ